MRTDRRGSLRTALTISKQVWVHPANRGRRVRALGTFAAWQVWERAVRRPWTLRISEGRKLRLPPHTPTASAFLYYRVPDYAELSFLRRWMRTGGLFVDVGANIGAYSLLATEPEGARAVAFEPDVAALRNLVDNVALNGLEEAIEIVPMAVSSWAGSSRLTVGRGPQNKLLDDAEVTGPAQPVEVTTLDEWLRDRDDPVLVKIDVEGHEIDVLRGARSMLGRARPALIVENNHPRELGALLSEIGYTIVRFDPETGALEAAEEGSDSEANLIAVPDLSEARRRLERP